jgi:hypothetical protein
LAALVLVLAAGCGSVATVSPTPAPSPSSSHALVEVANPGDVTDTTGVADKTCRLRGMLPDPACTPGGIDPGITAAVLCDPGYSPRYYRPSPSEFARSKDAALTVYGLPQDTVAQYDHLVNLDLAGDNDRANLWPQPGGTPNIKDGVERRLHNWVCKVSGLAAERRLGEAQRAIATNWTTAEARLGLPA